MYLRVGYYINTIIDNTIYLIINFGNFGLINNQFFSRFMILFDFRNFFIVILPHFSTKNILLFCREDTKRKNHYSNVLRTTSIVKKRSSNYKVSINTWRTLSGKFYRVRIKDTKFVILRLHFQQPLFITVNENDKSRLESRGFYPVLWAELYNGSYALRGLW